MIKKDFGQVKMFKITSLEFLYNLGDRAARFGKKDGRKEEAYLLWIQEACVYRRRQ